MELAAVQAVVELKVAAMQQLQDLATDIAQLHNGAK